MFGRRRKRHRQERHARGPFFSQLLIGIVLALFLILLGAVVWYGTRLEPFTIIEVRVAGGETIDREAVRAVAEAQLHGEYYRVVPRRFAWTYPEDDIIAKVKELPRVKTASVTRLDLRVIEVALVEYEPFALWCAAGREAPAGEPCVFVDDQGHAFVGSPPLWGSSFLRYKNGNIPSVGDTPFSASFLRETRLIASEVWRRFGFAVAAVERVGYDEASFHLQDGGVLRTTLRQSARDTLENLGVILSSDEFKHLAPGNFQYIDLRFGDKVFVNEDGGLEDEEAIASSTPSQP